MISGRGTERPSAGGTSCLLETREPPRREAVCREAGDGHESRVERHLESRLEEPHARLVSVGPGDVGPEGLPVLVLVEPGVLLEVRDGREVVAEDGVAHPHRRQRVLAADRVVLRHPFDHEEREANELLERAPALRDVVLELVDELVAQHVLRLRVGARHWEHDPLAKPLGHALRPLADVGDVGLPEVRVIGVEDDRLALVELVVQHGREAGVPALGHARDVARSLLFLDVVVDVEVLGFEHLEVEVVVPDLVAAELGLGRHRRQEADGDEDGESEKRESGHEWSGRVAQKPGEKAPG